MEKPGNFFDWCMQLLHVDGTTAKKQLDTLQRLLYKVANKFPLTGELRQRQCPRAGKLTNNELPQRKLLITHTASRSLR